MNEQALARARALISRGGRRILGLIGPPGAGKSTLAQQLVDALDGAAVLLPMDGFHLANVELARLGRAGRKGAPDTFDATGYAALLQRVRSGGEAVVYAPEFRREIEEPIASAIPIPPEVPLVITEGNYLLLDQQGWSGVRALLDEAWYVDVDEGLRRQRLVERHMRFGRTRDAALAWEAGTDQPNALLIEATAVRADWRVCL